MNYHLGELCRETSTFLEKTPPLWEKIRERYIQMNTNEMTLLPILDMTSTNLEDGIAISILLSEISNLSNRILTYDPKQFHWISLEHPSTIFEKKRQIQIHNLFSSNNPTQTSKINPNPKPTPSLLPIEPIIKSILETKLPLEKIEQMYLVFISDFQTKTEEPNHYSRIKQMFRENGIAKIPNIIYWNISTERIPILPCSPTTPNVIFLAGTASSNFQQLFEFCKSNADTGPIHPFSYYKKILNQEKYQPFERYLYQRIL
jgi:hypothetical protein